MHAIADSPFLKKVTGLALTRRLTLGGGLALVLILLGIGYSAFGYERRSNEIVSHSYRILANLETILTGLADIESAQRGYALEGNPSAYSEMRHGLSDVERAEKDTRLLVAGSPEETKRIDHIIAVTDYLLSRSNRGTTSVGSGPALDSLVNLRPARVDVGAMLDFERTVLRNRLEVQARNQRRATVIVVGASVLAGIVSLLTALLLGRAQEQEREAARRVAEQADRLSRANKELAARSDELELVAQEAEEANAAKADFLAAMSHELRTPLNAIMGYVDILELGIHGTLDVAQKDDCQRIRHNSQHLLGLINNVLNFVKLEKGTVEYEFEAVHIQQLLDDVEPLMAPQFAQKQIQVAWNVVDDCVVHVDHDKAVQILLNLLTNAWKFTPRGGQVTVTARRVERAEGSGIVCSIEDTGRGIPPDRLDQIFEPFVQVDRQLHLTSNQGVGLGLAISRELAVRMGGDLWVESLVGVGSTFSVLFPCLGKEDGVTGAENRLG